MAVEVKRPAAQQLIHSLLTEMAEKDGMDPEEQELLDWVATTWELGPIS